MSHRVTWSHAGRYDATRRGLLVYLARALATTGPARDGDTNTRADPDDVLIRHEERFMNILAVRSVFTSTQLYRAKRGASIGRALDTRSSRRGSHHRHGAVRVRDGRGYSPEDGRARYLRRARDAPPRSPAPERRVFPLIFTHRRRSPRCAGRRATPSRAHAGCASDAPPPPAAPRGPRRGHRQEPDRLQALHRDHLARGRLPRRLPGLRQVRRHPGKRLGLPSRGQRVHDPRGQVPGTVRPDGPAPRRRGHAAPRRRRLRQGMRPEDGVTRATRTRLATQPADPRGPRRSLARHPP